MAPPNSNFIHVWIPKVPSQSCVPGVAAVASLALSSGFRVQGSGFRVQGAGFRVSGIGLRVEAWCSDPRGEGDRRSRCLTGGGGDSEPPGIGLRVWDRGFQLVQSSGFRVWGSGCRVQGSGFRVQDSWFKVLGFGFWVLSFGFGLTRAPKRT